MLRVQRGSASTCVGRSTQSLYGHPFPVDDIFSSTDPHSFGMQAAVSH